MKKYVKPMLQAEEFVAQEYVAACYIVKCSVGRGITLWQESNGKTGLQQKPGGDKLTCTNTNWWHTHDKNCYLNGYDADTKLASGKGCGTAHPAVLKAPVYNGYVTTGNESPSDFNCFIFKQEWSHGASSSDWHGSLLLPGDVDASNPKAS